jgi:hypothetical protein
MSAGKPCVRKKFKTAKGIRMPARSIVSNRNQMRQAREALKAVPLEQREELRRNGIGPGDSYGSAFNGENHPDVKSRSSPRSRRVGALEYRLAD